ncbi:MAG TPA: hypothetical protein VFX38_06335 [Gammaproteobacteria bacterium]|nr:hypothetical protein [Gammaproteobacteria bacterium]
MNRAIAEWRIVSGAGAHMGWSLLIVSGPAIYTFIPAQAGIQ